MASLCVVRLCLRSNLVDEQGLQMHHLSWALMYLFYESFFRSCFKSLPIEYHRASS